MDDLKAWFVVQNSKNGSCDPDGGSNYQYGRSKCQEGSRSVNCDSLPVHCIALIVGQYYAKHVYRTICNIQKNHDNMQNNMQLIMGVSELKNRYQNLAKFHMHNMHSIF